MLSSRLAGSALRFFFSGPLFPKQKKKRRAELCQGLRGSVCLSSVCLAGVCLHRLAQKQKTKSLFVFGGWLFAFASPRLPRTREKDKKPFCFWRLAFCFFSASRGGVGGVTHTYIYIYLKRPSVASACKHAHTYIPEAPDGRCAKKAPKAPRL